MYSQFRVFVFFGLAALVFTVGCGSDDSDPFQGSQADADAQDVLPEADSDSHSDSDAADLSDTPETTDSDATDTQKWDTGFIDVDENATHPVTERGKYNVGMREYTVTYQAEADKTDEQRKLNLSVWYPTLKRDGPPADYGGFWTRDEVIQDPPPAETDTKRPLLIFSHGNGALAEQSYFQTEFWASHGWIVASPDHTGNTMKQGVAINLEAAIYRPQDIRAVLDFIYDLPASDQLSDQISDKVAMSGHSFGGYTTLANGGASYAVEDLATRCENGSISQDYCDTFSTEKRKQLFRKGFYDDRVDVALPQAPAGDLIFQEGLADLKPPVMLFTGGMDKTLPNSDEGDPIWRQMKGQKHRRINIPTAGHFTFSNMCKHFGGIPQVRKDGCGDDNIEPKLAHRIINTYSLAFARVHLGLGDVESARAIVDGEDEPVAPDDFEYSIGAE